MKELILKHDKTSISIVNSRKAISFVARGQKKTDFIAKRKLRSAKNENRIILKSEIRTEDKSWKHRSVVLYHVSYQTFYDIVVSGARIVFLLFIYFSSILNPSLTTVSRAFNIKYKSNKQLHTIIYFLQFEIFFSLYFIEYSCPS